MVRGTVWILATLIGWLPTGSNLANARPTQLLDAHSHYTASDAREMAASDIIERLDAAGVSRVVITGAPWQLARQLHERAPDRVIPLLGAYASDADKASWMYDRELPARMAARLAEGPWAGIGELHLFGRDAGNGVYAELVRLAHRHDLMLLVHGDEAVVDRAFEIAPDLRVLWAHLGTEPQPAMVARVLERHAGRALWIDTSVRDDRIAPRGQLLPEWRELFEAHPHRFVVAVDAFSTRRWQRYAEVTQQIRQWVSGLPPDLQERLLWRNAGELFRPWLERRR